MLITSYTTELDGNKNVLVEEKAIQYKQVKLNNPETIVNMMNDVFRLKLKAEEHVYVIAVNTACDIIGVFLISKGTVNESLINPRDIFIRLLLCGASGFMMVHNHPSGNNKPSKEDVLVTKRIKTCSTMMGVELHDHIIIGKSYYSFKGDGAL